MGNSKSKGATKDPTPRQQAQTDQQAHVARNTQQLDALNAALPPAAVYELASFDIKPEKFNEFSQALVKFYSDRQGCRIITVLAEVGSTHIKALVMFNSYYDYDQCKLVQEGDPQYSNLRTCIKSANSDIVAQTTDRFRPFITRQYGDLFRSSITTELDVDGCAYFLVRNPQPEAPPSGLYVAESFNSRFIFFGQGSVCAPALELCGCFTLLTTEPGDFYELWRTRSAADAHVALLECAGLNADGTTKRDLAAARMRDKKVELCRVVPGMSTAFKTPGAMGGAPNPWGDNPAGQTGVPGDL